MDYGPAALPVAVPIGGGLFLIVLAGLLAFLAGRSFLRRSAFAPMALLGAISLALGLSGAQLVERGWAGLAAVQLDNPAGDTVDIFPGYREYQNAAGGPLAIQRIELAECALASHVATVSPHPSCATGMILGSGDTCQTDYPACGCGNPNGGALTSDNGTGTGGLYCYEAEDSLDTLARKACESHFGEGECCIIPSGYNSLQWGQCGMGGGEGTIHWHPDSHPDGHCGPVYVEGDVISPGWLTGQAVQQCCGGSAGHRPRAASLSLQQSQQRRPMPRQARSAGGAEQGVGKGTLVGLQCLDALFHRVGTLRLSLPEPRRGFGCE